MRPQLAPRGAPGTPGRSRRIAVGCTAICDTRSNPSALSDARSTSNTAARCSSVRSPRRRPFRSKSSTPETLVFERDGLVDDPVQSPGTPARTRGGAVDLEEMFPPYDSGPWPVGLSLRREDLYDDRGR